MAEVLLRRRVDSLGAQVRVSSAGLLAGGRQATDHGRAAMARRGLDLTDHRSRQIGRELIAGADLIIAMAREHVREAAVLDPDAFARAYTLKELARAASAAGPRSSDEPLPAWLARVGAGRKRDALVGAGQDEAYDVADPIGRGAADYERTADEIDHLLGIVVAMAWPAAGQDEQERSA